MDIQLKTLSRIFNNQEFIEIDSTYFTSEDYRRIYKALEKLYVAQDKVPSISYFSSSIISKITKDEAEKKKLKEIVTNLPDDVDETNAELKELMEESYKKVSLVNLTKELAENLKKDEFSEIIGIINKMQAVNESGSDTFLEADNELFGEEEYINRISTGLPSRDKDLSTVPESSVILFSAPPKSGKTLFAVMGAINNYFNYEGNLAIYSYEMSKIQLMCRIKSMLSGVPYSEVEVGDYTLKESKLKVRAIELAFIYNIKPKDAMNLILDKGEHVFESLPKRKSKIFIRAGASNREIKEARKRGRYIRPLPDRTELIRELKLLHKAYGLKYFVVDYLQIVPLLPREEREKGITELVREIKEFTIDSASIAYCPVQSEVDPRIVKYARSLASYCDLQIVIIRNQELDAFKTIGIGVGMNRHGVWGHASIFENHMDRMNVEEIEDRMRTIDELLDKKDKGK